MPNFVFYDTETTGLSREFDQILQFAAIQTDDTFKELERFEIRCRCLPWVVPAPMALKVTGVSPNQLTDPALPSFFNMMGEIRRKLASWSPAIFIGYNSIRFDEPLLQRAFWQTLHPPYLTVTGGSARIDLLPIVQAASHLAEGALVYPQSDRGNTGFKLDALAPLNGFAHKNAHDALADVEATVHIARLIANRVPTLWQSAVSRAPKQATANVLEKGQPVYVVEYFMGKPAAWWGQRLDDHGAKGSNASVARLDQDWEHLASVNEEDLAKLLTSFPKPLRHLGMNKAPIVFTEAEAGAYWAVELDEQASSKSAFLNASPDTCRRILARDEALQEPWPEAEHLEQRIFEGFPSRDDEHRMLAFQSADWSKRARLMRTFEDNRLSQLAQRIVYVDAPDTLEPSDRERVETAITERLMVDHGDDKLWRTIPAAMRELASVRAEEGGDEVARQIEMWLRSIGQ